MRKRRQVPRHIRLYPRYTLEIVEETELYVITPTDKFYKLSENIMVRGEVRDQIYNVLFSCNKATPLDTLIHAIRQTIIDNSYDFEGGYVGAGGIIRWRKKLSKDDTFEPLP